MNSPLKQESAKEYYIEGLTQHNYMGSTFSEQEIPSGIMFCRALCDTLKSCSDIGSGSVDQYVVNSCQ